MVAQVFYETVLGHAAAIRQACPTAATWSVPSVVIGAAVAKQSESKRSDLSVAVCTELIESVCAVAELSVLMCGGMTSSLFRLRAQRPAVWPGVRPAYLQSAGLACCLTWTASAGVLPLSVVSAEQQIGTTKCDYMNELPFAVPDSNVDRIVIQRCLVRSCCLPWQRACRFLTDLCGMPCRLFTTWHSLETTASSGAARA